MRLINMKGIVRIRQENCRASIYICYRTLEKAGKFITLPVHGKDLKVGLENALLKQAGLVKKK